jgi:iron(II)-dependent oxidoreductase
MVDPLSDDDVHKQFNSIMSPVVWDVGHVGNFEEYWLLRTSSRPSPSTADRIGSRCRRATLSR